MVELLASFTDRAVLGEGPLWDAATATLTVVDPIAGRILTWSAREGMLHGQPVGGSDHVSLVPVVGGGRLGLAGDGRMDLDRAGSMTRSWRRVATGEHESLNDSACDTSGQLWIASLDARPRGRQGRVWRIDPSGNATVALTGFRCANGIGWSPDGLELYVVESRDRRIYAWDFDPVAGPVGPRRTVRQFSRIDGKPDGLAVDSEGALWVAMWDGWSIRRIDPADPTGAGDAIHRLPVARVTSCAFGGPRLTTLFITTSTPDLTAEDLAAQPMAGRVFTLEAPVAGMPIHGFAAPGRSI